MLAQDRSPAVQGIDVPRDAEHYFSPDQLRTRSDRIYLQFCFCRTKVLSSLLLFVEAEGEEGSGSKENAEMVHDCRRRYEGVSLDHRAFWLFATGKIECSYGVRWFSPLKSELTMPLSRVGVFQVGLSRNTFGVKT